MNKKIIKILVGLFFINMVVFSQTRITTDFKDYRLEIFESTNINNLEIKGNHANINLLNWDKDSISVETILEIISDKPNLSKEMLDEVTIKIVTYGNTLQVRTSFSEDFNRTIPYKINYNIFFPKNLSVNLFNSHGSVSLSECIGGIKTNLNYCDININNIATDNNSLANSCEFNYCKGHINHLGTSQLTVNNSELNIMEVNDIMINSEYSLIDIKQANSIQGTSKIDNLLIGDISDIKLKASNSTVNINNIGVNALFECESGTLNISNSAKDLSQLTINNSKTATTIKLHPLLSYYINGEIYKGKLIHPQQNNIQIIKDLEKISINGTVGVMDQSESKVIIFNKNQNIEFK
ncbi:hypothetical protein [Plebeiibacterium marinum]|uniref:Adhesin domain-containing protein n=1 Tax=Plebeiibacterium marinum TaxID=2992111 RepID=A0AAE3MGE2_9BACT|nr:hypothetical protein [Plebeiobacterium marinum]MCW3807251.1 hypothetical protein [Plebeiobacterium marinum]